MSSSEIFDWKWNQVNLHLILKVTECPFKPYKFTFYHFRLFPLSSSLLPPPGLWAVGAEEQEAEKRGTSNTIYLGYSLSLLGLDHTDYCSAHVQSGLLQIGSTLRHLEQKQITQKSQVHEVNLYCWLCPQVDSLSEEQQRLTEALRAHEPFCPIMHCSFASSTSSGLQPDSMAARSVWGEKTCFQPNFWGSSLCKWTSAPLGVAVDHDEHQSGDATGVLCCWAVVTVKSALWW